MGHYRHLIQEQRYAINMLLKTNHNHTEIAGVIGVHKSTISRELRRNKGLAWISKQTGPRSGHSSVSTTSVYSAVVNKDLNNALERLD